MFPTRLNLLPPDKQRGLQKMITTEFVTHSLEMVLIMLCIVSIMLLGGRHVIQNYFNDLAESLVVVSNQYTKNNMVIKEINRTLHDVRGIQREYVLWTPIIAQISEAAPENVVLSQMDITKDSTERTLTLSGTAPDRGALLLFKQRMEALPFVSPIAIPLSQLTKKEDIQFSFSTAITP